MWGGSAHGIARAVHADWTRGGSRISGGERRAERGVGRLMERWLGDAAERSRLIVASGKGARG
jgi:hypothetical protein